MRAKHVPSISRRAPSIGTIRTMPRDKEPPFRELHDLGLEIGCFLSPMAAVAHRGCIFSQSGSLSSSGYVYEPCMQKQVVENLKMIRR